jgi:hypothetical protein
VQAEPEPVVHPKVQQAAQQASVEPEVRMVAVGGGRPEPVLPLHRFPERLVTREHLTELDIPTFIRRQMD